MKVLLVIASVLFATTTASVAQQGKTTKEKAPAGCITCKEMCNWCVSQGLQPKADALPGSSCHAGCAAWRNMVGLPAVYVHRNKSLCGKGNYAPRCN